MKKTYETGLEGEKAAENWLRDRMSMICLERRFRSRAGEIDLIMQDGDTIVFVEVKNRKHGKPGSGLLAIDRNKQRRIGRAATLYLLQTGGMNRSCRFDFIEIIGGEIRYIPNAYQPGGMFFR